MSVIIPAAETGLPNGTFAATTVTTNFVDTGGMYWERVDEIDSKVFRFMGRRATAGFEIFNLLNNSDVFELQRHFDTGQPRDSAGRSERSTFHWAPSRRGAGLFWG